MDDTERLERRRASARAYHARNREKVREQSRAWREANLEYARTKAREWNARNRELCHQRDRAWYEANPDAAKERTRVWRENNGERYLATAAQGLLRRRARLAEANCQLSSPAERASLPRICQACGAPAEELDHVVPVARGGCGNMHNLQWLCFACNRAKGARMPEQYHGCPVFWGAPLD